MGFRRQCSEITDSRYQLRERIRSKTQLKIDLVADRQCLIAGDVLPAVIRSSVFNCVEFRYALTNFRRRLWGH